ncbi:MAG: nucleoside triphosphate pyrophosphohydrolase [Lentisphaerales bacterium]|nr:MAG: nucleoside triphosphate pyrophosphohydrolase [Lentisphaerales bacterium]
MTGLTDIMAKLRGEGGCPWDRQQTLESLKQYLIEESYEVIDAIDSGDPERHRDELCDLLLQVLFQSQIRNEEGKFSFADVVEALEQKLVRRHPHVFGEETAETPEQVLKRWEEIKGSEKGSKTRDSVVDGVPRALPALVKAQRIQSRTARGGFDWPDTDGVVAKIEEELQEVRETIAQQDADRQKEELGDLLFSVVNLSRFLGISAELALQEAVDRFCSRFRTVEKLAEANGEKMSDCNLEKMEQYWQAAKVSQNS